jgi:hypothetical protein
MLDTICWIRDKGWGRGSEGWVEGGRMAMVLAYEKGL